LSGVLLGLWLAGAVLLALLSSGVALERLMRYWLLAALGLPVAGLLLVEQLFRNLPEDARWNAKPVCLGLAAIFVFDIYFYSEAVLFGRFDTDAGHVRGVVHALALPLIYVASRRRGDWIGRLQVSRQVAFYSASLLLVGGYLLFIARPGVRRACLRWRLGPRLPAGAAEQRAAAGLVLLLSGSLRARLRVFVGKHFFSYRYDYREQWLRFTNMLSSPTATEDVGGLVVRGLADMLESPGGSLWAPQRRRHGPRADGTLEPARRGRVRIHQRRAGAVSSQHGLDHRHRRIPQCPQALRHASAARLAVVGSQSLAADSAERARRSAGLRGAGAAAHADPDELGDARSGEDRQPPGRGFLAQMHATEALLELRKFEAFNRMSAFVVHDLRTSSPSCR